MKKALILLVGVCTSFTAWAYVERSGGSLNVNLPVNEDFYASGGRIRIASPISGDMVMAGGDITVAERISEDLMVAGGKVQIVGEVGDDARVAGKWVILKGNVNDDLLVAGKKVAVEDTVKVNGDISIAAKKGDFGGLVLGKGRFMTQSLNFQGVVDGNVEIYTKELTVDPESQIRGDLYLEGPTEIPAVLQEVVKGEITHKPIYQEAKGPWKSLFSWFLLYKFAFLVLFGSCLYFGIEKFWRETADHLKNEKWKSLGKGLLFFLIPPVLMVLAFVSFIGIPIGLFIGALYGFAILFSELITVSVFTGLLVNRYLSGKEESKVSKFGVIFGLAFLATVLCGVDFLFALFAFGALLTQKQNILKKFF